MAIRDGGREAIVYSEPPESSVLVECRLYRYRIKPEYGCVEDSEVIDQDADLELWLDEHSGELDWIRHEYRRELGMEE